MKMLKCVIKIRVSFGVVVLHQPHRWSFRKEKPHTYLITHQTLQA
jgi:hypothetical protein